MGTTKYYHKNSDVVAFERFENSNGDWEEITYNKRGNELTYKTLDGYWEERTYDERGNQLTYKDSDGYCSERTYDERGNELTCKDSDGLYHIKNKRVTQEDFEAFVNNQNRPCVGKKVVVDGIEYELK